MKDEQRISQCMACHKVFRTTSQFNAHRVIKDKKRVCCTEGWNQKDGFYISPEAEKNSHLLRDRLAQLRTKTDYA